MHMKKTYMIALCLLTLSGSVSAQNTIAIGESFIDEPSTSAGVVVDSYVADYPEIQAWDQLLKDKWVGDPIFHVDTSAMNVFGYDVDSRPVFHDSVYINRIEELNQATPFNLSYNRHVRSTINHYTGRGRLVTSRVLGLAEMYFPMIEEILEREGLPLEMKYLAIVESALKPKARSRAGATGLWQFMYGTAKENGLKINSYVDERMDPIKSTEAACKYLKFLYGLYGDWGLALAAYNSGPGNVNKAIRRSGGKKDYWGIWNWLPRETRGYIPAFIAVNYVMNYNVEHNIFPTAPPRNYFEFDTVQVKGSYNFAQIAAYTGASIEELNWLNPSYKKGFIPQSMKGSTLMLPVEDVGLFIMNEEKIRSHQTTVSSVPAATSSHADPYSTVGKEKTYYTVREGDVLGVIADRHGVGLSKIRAWNNIRGNRIYPGQKLAIYRKPGSKTVAQRKTTSSGSKQTSHAPIDPNARYHTIRKGDTLWDIAKLYNGVTVTDIKKWNSHLNFKNLKLGQKVRVSG